MNCYASYTVLRNVRLALADCQATYALETPAQSTLLSVSPDAPSGSTSTELVTPQAKAKTLVRLVRCHFTLGASTLALDFPPLTPAQTSAGKQETQMPPTPVEQLEAQVLDLVAHLRSFDTAKASREWGLVFGKCFRAITAARATRPRSGVTRG